MSAQSEALRRLAFRTLLVFAMIGVVSVVSCIGYALRVLWKGLV